jgi:dipeptidyl aminopeptidase/acylaminoacyl peptidase
MTLRVAVLALSTFALQAQIRSADYFDFRFLGDFRLAPDGRRIAYVVTTIDKEANRRQSAIRLIGVDGAGDRELTADGAAPRFSPDGRTLAFLSSRGGGRPQLYLLPLDGGEARRLTSLEEGVTSCSWSPDGSRFACLSRTGRTRSASDVRHYTRIRYKFNDTGWFDATRAHIFVIDAATGAARQITDGTEWNDVDPRWSPDGKSIAFVSDRTGTEYDGGRNTDVWVVAAEGGKPRRISEHAEADGSPRWSPDGRWIAYVGVAERDGPAEIYLAPAGGGPSRKATPALDQTVADLDWSPDGKALHFVSGVRGETHLYRIDAGSGEVRAVTSGPRAIRAYDTDGKVLVYSADDFQNLPDLYVDGRRITRLNEKLFAGRKLASVERVPYRAADGWEIDGFLVRPLDFDPAKKYPLVLSVHGGPAGMYGVDWFHEFQVYAAKGWAVFFTNPRGSTGYGHKFARAVAKEWGGKAYTDIMSGVEHVVKRYPFIDADRLGMTGGSYGGFMVNWISTQSPIFKAAVTLRCISNFISDEGTRDGAFGHDRDFGGDLWENFELYWHFSPLKHVKRVRTPTLVLHAENDHRTPLEQGEQWFRALQHHGIVSEFVIFPRENHNLTRTGEPRHIVESLDWQCYWFDRFLNGNARARRPNEAPAAAESALR